MNLAHVKVKKELQKSVNDEISQSNYKARAIEDLYHINASLYRRMVEANKEEGYKIVVERGRFGEEDVIKKVRLIK